MTKTEINFYKNKKNRFIKIKEKLRFYVEIKTD